jgi:hypothetical protein
MGAAAHVKLPKKAGESRDEWYRPSAGKTGAPVEISATGRSAYHDMHASAGTIWHGSKRSISASERQQVSSSSTEERARQTTTYHNTDPTFQQLVNIRLRGLITALEGNVTALEERMSQAEEFSLPGWSRMSPPSSRKSRPLNEHTMTCRPALVRLAWRVKEDIRR